MLEKASLVINPTKEKDLLRIMPCTPQVSSTRLNWKHIHVAYYQLPAYEFPEHTFSKHLISLNVGASTKLERAIDNRIQGECFATGEILWINPARMQRTIRIMNPAQVIHIYLDPEFVSHFAQDLIDPDRVEILASFHPQDSLFQHLGFTLKAAVLQNTVIDALYADTAATMLAIHLLRHYSNFSIAEQQINQPHQSKVQDAIDYIHAHLDEELCIDVLARLVNMSPYYFIRLFKRIMGLTPHCYIVRQRLERAKQLLRSTNLSIAEIAFSTGFCDQSRFSVVFRQYIKTSPKAYREQQ